VFLVGFLFPSVHVVVHRPRVFDITVKKTVEASFSFGVLLDGDQSFLQLTAPCLDLIV